MDECDWSIYNRKWYNIPPRKQGEPYVTWKEREKK